jgi:hypothetical protein
VDLQKLSDLPRIRPWPGDPYAKPAKLTPQNRKLWEKTEADNVRHAAMREARLDQWEAEREARINAAQPAGPAPLFTGERFTALDTIEHLIHQALNSWLQDRDDRHAAELWEARMDDHPREALRYLTERAEALGEDWATICAILKIRIKLGDKNAA